MLFFTRGRLTVLLLTAVLYLGGAAAILHFLDDQAAQALVSLPAQLVLALVALSLLNYAVRAWRWQVFTRHLRLPVPAAANMAYYLAGYALTATPGKAGEAIRLWFLKSAHGVPYRHSLPIMVGDRVLDLWAVLLIVLVSMAGFAAYVGYSLAVAALVAMASLVILYPMRLTGVLNLAYGRWPRFGRLLGRLRQTARAMDQLRSIRTYGWTLPPTVVGWFAEGVSLYLIVHYFGADLSLQAVCFVFAFSMLVGALSMLPGGLGSTEATMVLLLTTLGMGLDAAVAATALFRVATFWFAIVIGLLVAPHALRVAGRSRAQTVAHLKEGTA